MGSLLDEPTLIEDQDTIGSLNGGEPVGDDEGRATGHEALERFLYQPFRFRIERRCGLIEEEHAWILEDGPRDGETLALSS